MQQCMHKQQHKMSSSQLDYINPIYSNSYTTAFLYYAQTRDAGNTTPPNCEPQYRRYIITVDNMHKISGAGPPLIEYLVLAMAHLSEILVLVTGPTLL